MFLTDILEEKPTGLIVVYGPAASGKSALCLSTLHGKCAYIASGHNFSPERLRAMRADADAVLERTSVFSPSSLAELERSVDQAVQLSRVLSLIVVDSLGTLVRAAERKESNLALDRIMRKLAMALCPVLVTTDVLDRPVRGMTELGFVGGDLLRVAARTLIELHDGKATVKKHPELAGRVWAYRIVASGLEKI